MKLSCHATGTPTPNITWSRPGNKEWRETNSPLLLKNISRYQDGEYVCTVMNYAGNATASVMVTVNCKYEIVARSFKCFASYPRHSYINREMFPPESKLQGVPRLWE